MPRQEMQKVLGFVPEALAATQVGTWETDFGNDRTVADSVTAQLFNVDPDQAAEGLPLAAYAKAILPADRQQFSENISRVFEHGGIFIVEYRVNSVARGIRWVLARGVYDRDERTGRVIGRGIVLDITECKLNGQAEERAFFVSPSTSEPPLDRLAACALEARRIVDEVNHHARPALRLAVDSLLWAVGRAMGNRLRH